MNQDPNYQFMKGVGWVPSTTNWGIILDLKGKQWRVTESPNPVVGKIWDAANQYPKNTGFREYLALRNDNCNPDNWGPWEAHYARSYNIYFIYERVA